MQIESSMIDILVAQIGLPICVHTDDGEDCFYRFADSDKYVADSVGELVLAAYDDFKHML